jgi:hypothetical protein
MQDVHRLHRRWRSTLANGCSDLTHLDGIGLGGRKRAVFWLWRKVLGREYPTRFLLFGLVI